MRFVLLSCFTHATMALVALILSCYPLYAIAVEKPISMLVSDAGIGADHLLEHLEYNNNYTKNGRWLELSATGLLGDVALTTVAGTPQQSIGQAVGTTGTTKAVGSSVFGPFEGGFGTIQNVVIRNQFGCQSDVTHCYSEGGVDVATAQAICATNCNMELPRIEDGIHYGLLDSCGGHVAYHFHREMKCLYDMEEGDTHAPAIAETVTSIGGGNGGGGGGNRPPPPPGGGPPPSGGGGRPNGGGRPGGRSLDSHSRLLQDEKQQYVYGLWEDYSSSTLPVLDACNGHWGVTPDSPDTMVYHYHITESAPFSIGCFGPSQDGGLVTVAQCRDLYTGCSDTEPLQMLTFEVDGVMKTIPYQPWCPCFDKSGVSLDGNGLNVGNADANRAWIKREYNSNTAQWETTASGILADIPEYSSGISIVEIDTQGNNKNADTNLKANGEASDGVGRNTFLSFLVGCATVFPLLLQ